MCGHDSKKDKMEIAEVWREPILVPYSWRDLQTIGGEPAQDAFKRDLSCLGLVLGANSIKHQFSISNIWCNQ